MLTREAESGFGRLAGTQLNGTVPVTQRVLNDLLQRVPRAPSGLALEIHPDNRLVARFGFVHATAVLDEVIDVGGAPQIHVELGSSVVAWSLKKALDMPGLSFDGRRVTIDLGAVAALDGYRAYWRYLRTARVRTTAGAIRVEFVVAVA